MAENPKQRFRRILNDLSQDDRTFLDSNLRRIYSESLSYGLKNKFLSTDEVTKYQSYAQQRDAALRKVNVLDPQGNPISKETTVPVMRNGQYVQEKRVTPVTPFDLLRKTGGQMEGGAVDGPLFTGYTLDTESPLGTPRKKFQEEVIPAGQKAARELERTQGQTAMNNPLTGAALTAGAVYGAGRGLYKTAITPAAVGVARGIGLVNPDAGRLMEEGIARDFYPQATIDVSKPFQTGADVAEISGATFAENVVPSVVGSVAGGAAAVPTTFALGPIAGAAVGVGTGLAAGVGTRQAQNFLAELAMGSSYKPSETGFGFDIERSPVSEARARFMQERTELAPSAAYAGELATNFTLATPNLPTGFFGGVKSGLAATKLGPAARQSLAAAAIPTEGLAGKVATTPFMQGARTLGQNLEKIPGVGTAATFGRGFAASAPGREFLSDVTERGVEASSDLAMALQDNANRPPEERDPLWMILGKTALGGMFEGQHKLGRYLNAPGQRLGQSITRGLDARFGTYTPSAYEPIDVPSPFARTPKVTTPGGPSPVSTAPGMQQTFAEARNQPSPVSRNPLGENVVPIGGGRVVTVNPVDMSATISNAPSFESDRMAAENPLVGQSLLNAVSSLAPKKGYSFAGNYAKAASTFGKVQTRGDESQAFLGMTHDGLAMVKTTNRKTGDSSIDLVSQDMLFGDNQKLAAQAMKIGGLTPSDKSGYQLKNYEYDLSRAADYVPSKDGEGPSDVDFNRRIDVVGTPLYGRVVKAIDKNYSVVQLPSPVGGFDMMVVPNDTVEGLSRDVVATNAEGEVLDTTSMVSDPSAFRVDRGKYDPIFKLSDRERFTGEAHPILLTPEQAADARNRRDTLNNYRNQMRSEGVPGGVAKTRLSAASKNTRKEFSKSFAKSNADYTVGSVVEYKTPDGGVDNGVVVGNTQYGPTVVSTSSPMSPAVTVQESAITRRYSATTPKEQPTTGRTRPTAPEATATAAPTPTPTPTPTQTEEPTARRTPRRTTPETTTPQVTPESTVEPEVAQERRRRRETGRQRRRTAEPTVSETPTATTRVTPEAVTPVVEATPVVTPTETPVTPSRRRRRQAPVDFIAEETPAEAREREAIARASEFDFTPDVAAEENVRTTSVQPVSTEPRVVASRPELQLSPDVAIVEFPEVTAPGIVDLKFTDSVTGVPEVISHSGRFITILNIKGQEVLYYLSSGENPKMDAATGEVVQPGKWYPFFGFSPKGWLNKGSSRNILDSYTLPDLKMGEDLLNNHYGDLRSLQTSNPEAMTTPKEELPNTKNIFFTELNTYNTTRVEGNPRRGKFAPILDRINSVIQGVEKGSDGVRDHIVNELRRLRDAWAEYDATAPTVAPEPTMISEADLMGEPDVLPSEEGSALDVTMPGDIEILDDDSLVRITASIEGLGDINDVFRKARNVNELKAILKQVVQDANVNMSEAEADKYADSVAKYYDEWMRAFVNRDLLIAQQYAQGVREFASTVTSGSNVKYSVEEVPILDTDTKQAAKQKRVRNRIARLYQKFDIPRVTNIIDMLNEEASKKVLVRNADGTYSPDADVMYFGDTLSTDQKRDVVRKVQTKLIQQRYQTNVPVFAVLAKAPNISAAFDDVFVGEGAYVNIRNSANDVGQQVVFVTMNQADAGTIIEELSHAILENMPIDMAREVATKLGKTLREPTTTNESVASYELQEMFAARMRMSFLNGENAFLESTGSREAKARMTELWSNIRTFMQRAYSEMSSSITTPRVEGEYDAQWSVPYDWKRISLWDYAPVIIDVNGVPVRGKILPTKKFPYGPQMVAERNLDKPIVAVELYNEDGTVTTDMVTPRDVIALSDDIGMSPEFGKMLLNFVSGSSGQRNVQVIGLDNPYNAVSEAIVENSYAGMTDRVKKFNDNTLKSYLRKLSSNKPEDIERASEDLSGIIPNKLLTIVNQANEYGLLSDVPTNSDDSLSLQNWLNVIGTMKDGQGRTREAFTKQGNRKLTAEKWMQRSLPDLQRAIEEASAYAPALEAQSRNQRQAYNVDAGNTGGNVLYSSRKNRFATQADKALADGQASTRNPDARTPVDFAEYATRNGLPRESVTPIVQQRIESDVLRSGLNNSNIRLMELNDVLIIDGTIGINESGVDTIGKAIDFAVRNNIPEALLVTKASPNEEIGYNDKRGYSVEPSVTFEFDGPVAENVYATMKRIYPYVRKSIDGQSVTLHNVDQRGKKYEASLATFEQAVSKIASELTKRGIPVQAVQDTERVWHFGNESAKGYTIPFYEARNVLHLIKPEIYETGHQLVTDQRLKDVIDRSLSSVAGREINIPGDWSYAQDNAERRIGIGSNYDKLPTNSYSTNPETKVAYDALMLELDRQFKYLNMQVGDVTSSTPATTKIVRSPDTKGHPLMANSKHVDVDGKPLRYIDVLDAIHSSISDAVDIASAGEHSDLASFAAHSAITKDVNALRALYTETLGRKVYEQLSNTSGSKTSSFPVFSNDKSAMGYDGEYNGNADYRSWTVMLSPNEFLDLVMPIGELQDYDLKSISRIKSGIQEGKKIANPWITVNWNIDTGKWEVTGHDGRHRAIAVNDIDSSQLIPVNVIPITSTSKKRNPSELKKRNVTVDMSLAEFVPEGQNVKKRKNQILNNNSIAVENFDVNSNAIVKIQTNTHKAAIAPIEDMKTGIVTLDKRVQKMYDTNKAPYGDLKPNQVTNPMGRVQFASGGGTPLYSLRPLSEIKTEKPGESIPSEESPVTFADEDGVETTFVDPAEYSAFMKTVQKIDESWLMKGLDIFNALGRLPMAGDWSAPLIQNWMLANPIESPDLFFKSLLFGPKSLAPNLGIDMGIGTINKKAFKGREQVHRMGNEMRSNKYYQLAKDSRLTLATSQYDRILEQLQTERENKLAEMRKTDPEATLPEIDLMDVNELDVDPDIQGLLSGERYIPGKASSERAMTMMKDYVKFNKFVQAMATYEELGYDPSSAGFKEAAADMAAILNVSNGDIKFSAQEYDKAIGRMMRRVMFAPRWLTSRVMADPLGRWALSQTEVGKKWMEVNGIPTTRSLNPYVYRANMKMLLKARALWYALLAYFGLYRPFDQFQVKTSVGNLGTKIQVGNYVFRAPGGSMMFLEFADSFFGAMKMSPKDSPEDARSKFTKMMGSFVMGRIINAPAVSMMTEMFTGRDFMGKPIGYVDEDLKAWYDDVTKPMLNQIGIDAPEMKLSRFVTKNLLFLWIQSYLETYKMAKDREEEDKGFEAAFVGAMNALGGRVRYNPPSGPGEYNYDSYGNPPTAQNYLLGIDKEEWLMNPASDLRPDQMEQIEEEVTE